MAVRSYRAGDRSEVLELLGDPRAVDRPGARVVVAHDSSAPAGRRVAGVATWSRPEARGEDGPGRAPVWGRLGAVLVREPGSFPGRTRLFHELIRACVADAIVEGVARGSATVRERGVVNHLVDPSPEGLGLEAEPAGWDPETGEVVEWRFTVELGPFLDLLNRAIEKVP